MGQVPCYGIIGNGRVAKHMRHYLDILGLAWRDGNAELTLLLVSDSALHELAAKTRGTCLHFSGSQIIEGCPAAHPLYTFGNELYEEACYRSIPFVVDESAPDCPLPGLPNPIFRINQELRPLYHALCVLAGNFSCMLWQRLFCGFEEQLGLPREVAFPYLQRIAANLQGSGSALTGPLVRNDWNTIDSNLKALTDDSFHEVYSSFVDAWQSNHGIAHEQPELSSR